MSDVYHGYFTNWNDVRCQFQIMDEPEPEEVLYAEYDIDGYEGSAQVLYRNSNKVYYVTGGHCSCYGLEDQWEPEEYTPEMFVAAYERSQWYRNVPESVVNRVKELMENKYNGA